MTLPMIPPPSFRTWGAPTVRTAHAFLVEFRRGLAALSGQPATFARASTATMTDSGGTTLTVGHSRPRRESRLWFGTPELGLRMATDDLTYPLDGLPGTGTWLIEGVNLGTAQTSGAGLLYLGLDAGTGTRLVVRGTGTTVAVDLIVGANTSTATHPAACASGVAFQVVVQIEDTGTTQRVRIGGRIGSTEAFSAWGTAIARAAAWPSGSRVRLNRVGSAGTQGSVWLRTVGYMPGLHAYHELSGVL